MSETSQAPAPVPAPAPPAAPAEPAPGFFERAVEHVFPHDPHAAAVAGTIAADLKAAVQDHAGTVFDVAGDVLAIVKLVDPADAAAVAAGEALVAKVFSMTASAAKIAGAVHSA